MESTRSREEEPTAMAGSWFFRAAIAAMFVALTAVSARSRVTAARAS